MEEERRKKREKGRSGESGNEEKYNFSKSRPKKNCFQDLSHSTLLTLIYGVRGSNPGASPRTVSALGAILPRNKEN